MRNPTHRTATEWARDLIASEAQAAQGETVDGELVLAELMACLVRLDTRRAGRTPDSQTGALPIR